MKNLIAGGNAQMTESEKEVKTSSINSLNILPMGTFKLNIDLNGATAPLETTKALAKNNQPSLDAITKLAENGFYFMVQPRNNRKTGEAYVWITATKQGEDREEFSLYVNDEILNVVVATLLGKSAAISEINANELEEFNKKITNFELELFVTERAQGRTMKKTQTTNGHMFSSYYKRGVIIYHPYKNQEFKEYLYA